MNINTFEKHEPIPRLRAKVLQAEQERIDGEKTLSVSQARERLKERVKASPLYVPSINHPS